MKVKLCVTSSNTASNSKIESDESALPTQTTKTLVVLRKTTTSTTKISTISTTTKHTKLLCSCSKATSDLCEGTWGVLDIFKEKLSKLYPGTRTKTTAITTTKSKNPSCYIKMPLRHLIPTLLTAVVFAAEFSRCDTKLLDELIIGEKRPPNITIERKMLMMETYYNTEAQRMPLSHLPATAALTTAHIETSMSSTNQTLPHIRQASAPPSPSPSPLPTTTSSLILLSSMRSSSSTSTSTSTSTSSVLTLDRVTLAVSLESAALIEEPLNSNALGTYSPISLPRSDKTAVATSSSSSPTSSKSQPLLAISAVANATNTTNTTLILSEGDIEYSEEWLPTNSLNSVNDVSDLPPFDAEQQAAADLLTKGFSIPTFLPPFPVFAVADLPAYLNSVSTTTAAPSTLNHNNSLLLSSNEQSMSDVYDAHGNLLVLGQATLRQHARGATTNVTVQMGNHAYMPCQIQRLQNKPVSWVRVRDGHIISVDQTTFIADQRFQAIYQDDSEFTWSLQIKYVQPNDEGWYECQVSIEPKMSAKIHLKVVVPLTELIGDQSRFVKAGSKVALHCIVRGTLEPPQYIIWFRDKTQISEDNNQGWYTQLDRNIFGNNNSHSQNTIGSLIIPSVRKTDSGNYTCQPSNSAAISVDLHVLSGEYSASAIMSAASSCWSTLNHFFFYAIMVVILCMSAPET